MVGNYRIAESYPGRAIHPPIQPGDKNWRDYLSFGGRKRGLDSTYRTRTITEAYGPLWADFTLLPSSGKSRKTSGSTKRPRSAAMYLYAHETVKRESTIFFDEMHTDNIQ